MDKTRRNLLTTSAAAAAYLSSGLCYPAKKSSVKDDKLPDFVICDAGSLKAGETARVNVNNKPWFLVTRRTSEDKRNIVDGPYHLKDSNSDKSFQPHKMKNIFRSAKEEIFVVFAGCTHIGCIVNPVRKEYKVRPPIPIGGYFCRCHGGRFDQSGRVLSASPPHSNLVIPDYEFISPEKIKIYIKNYWEMASTEQSKETIR